MLHEVVFHRGANCNEQKEMAVTVPLWGTVYS
jgi:hypothetical protein